MNPFIEIKNRKIGLDYDPIVIAEIGINHGGSLEVAKKMVDAAAEVGAEIIKHQTHIVEDEMSKVAKSIIPSHTKESIFEIMTKCALPENEEIELQEYVENLGMIFISTPFSRAAVDRLVKMNVPAFKIGSGECNNYPLLKYIASFGKPVILSTGMNSINDIEIAVKILKERNIPFALLHTTNVYPTPPHLVRLGAMQELAHKFPEAVIGLSDHTTSNYACLGAVALGASILERHFTDSRKREGPDIVCSMDPKALKDLITGVKVIKETLGGTKGPVEEEKDTINFAYASVVTIKKINKNDIFTKENIWVKRPGTGEIPAAEFENILGRRSRNDIDADEQLKWSNIK